MSRGELGLLGSVAELETTKAQREFTVLSLATPSWKTMNGDGYIRRTEWNRLVAWGHLSTFCCDPEKARTCPSRASSATANSVPRNRRMVITEFVSPKFICPKFGNFHQHNVTGQCFTRHGGTLKGTLAPRLRNLGVLRAALCSTSLLSEPD